MFLARESYRRRRLGDAARVIPLIGFILMLLPGLMTSTNVALIYVFSLWAVLILIMVPLSRRLSKQEAADLSEDSAGAAGDP
jgi:hypothetical protein